MRSTTLRRLDVLPGGNGATHTHSPPLSVVGQGPAQELRAPDGGVVNVVGDALEFRDGDGRLLVRYQNGGLEVAPSKGDLRLRAPSGQVCIEAGSDIRLDAGRDLALVAARSAELSTSGANDLPSSLRVGSEGTLLSGRNLEMRSQRFRQFSSTIDVIATTLRSSATRLEANAKEYDVTVERQVVRARELVEEVTDLLEMRAGRVRALVKTVFRLHSRSTDMSSEGDTAIDGRRVLLG